MRIFLTESHLWLGADPVLDRGIKYDHEMARNGIWYPTLVHKDSETTSELRAELRLRRSRNQMAYLAAFKALEDLVPQNGDEYLAALSMIWLPILSGRLVTTDYTWLHIYHRNERVAGYTHDISDEPYRSFVHVLPEHERGHPERWTELFSRDLGLLA